MFSAVVFCVENYDRVTGEEAENWREMEGDCWTFTPRPSPIDGRGTGGSHAFEIVGL